MCLSVPGKVISLDGSCAKVQIGEITCEVCIKLVEEVEIGDYILIHAGFAIEKLSQEKADEILKLLNEIFCMGYS
ncbi:MAG TPA: HypC/HybG/HupF family hydrogenase formation chaperone [Bacteroidales bacterium]|nr:HypC/HybG/HupF family hydrogenase formation chaperone [Bacteroidales bacterium]